MEERIWEINQPSNKPCTPKASPVWNVKQMLSKAVMGFRWLNTRRVLTLVSSLLLSGLWFWLWECCTKQAIGFITWHLSSILQIHKRLLPSCHLNREAAADSRAPGKGWLSFPWHRQSRGQDYWVNNRFHSPAGASLPIDCLWGQEDGPEFVSLNNFELRGKTAVKTVSQKAQTLPECLITVDIKNHPQTRAALCLWPCHSSHQEVEFVSPKHAFYLRPCYNIAQLLTQPFVVFSFLLQPLNTLFMHLFVAVSEYSVDCCKEIIRWVAGALHTVTWGAGSSTVDKTH